MKFTMIQPDDLGRAIDKLAKAGGVLDSATHNTIVSALHDAQSGNMLNVSKVISALGKSQAKTTLLVYIKAHAPLVWSKKQAAFKLKKEKNRNPWMLAEAEDCPFWDFEPPKQDKAPFDASKIVTKLRKQIEEAITNGEFNTQQQNALRGGLAGVMVDYTESAKSTPAELVSGPSVNVPAPA